NGLQLVASEARTTSLGYVTSATPSVELDGWVGLALVAGGRRRLGERLIGTSPVHGEAVEIEIVSPHMLDPENLRVRACVRHAARILRGGSRRDRRSPRP